jgi:hypothetical protein
VSRATIIVFVALGAALAGFAIASRSGLGSQSSSTEASVAARPQEAKLSWRETYGEPGERLVFTVDSIAVTTSGWRARIGIENESQVAWKLSPGAVPDGNFGLALFETGDHRIRAQARHDPRAEGVVDG